LIAAFLVASQDQDGGTATPGCAEKKSKARVGTARSDYVTVFSLPESDIGFIVQFALDAEI
jgi:hypothetical protein